MSSFEDFRPYLDGVKESGSRSRSIIYVNIVLIAIGITMLRNYTYPTWDVAHFKAGIKISKCLSQLIRNRSVTEKESCDIELKERFNTNLEEILTLNPKIPKDIIGDQKTKHNVEQAVVALDELSRLDPSNVKIYEQTKYSIAKLLQKNFALEIDPFTKMLFKFADKEIEEKVKREYFEIPIFGISLHQNDAWMVTGVFNLVALIILHSFMKRELENIEAASKISGSSFTLGRLLLSTQVFATPEPQYGIAWLIRNIAFIALYFLPFAIHFWIVIDDISQSNVNVVYRLLNYNVAAAVFEYACELSTLFLLGYAGWRCYKIQFKINDEIIAVNSKITQA